MCFLKFLIFLKEFDIFEDLENDSYKKPPLLLIGNTYWKINLAVILATSEFFYEFFDTRKYFFPKNTFQKIVTRID